MQIAFHCIDSTSIYIVRDDKNAIGMGWWAYLSFFLHKCTFWAQFFSTWKRVNCGKISQNFPKFLKISQNFSTWQFVLHKYNLWHLTNMSSVCILYLCVSVFGISVSLYLLFVYPCIWVSVYEEEEEGGCQEQITQDIRISTTLPSPCIRLATPYYCLLLLLTSSYLLFFSTYYDWLHGV